MKNKCLLVVTINRLKGLIWAKTVYSKSDEVIVRSILISGTDSANRLFFLDIDFKEMLLVS